MKKVIKLLTLGIFVLIGVFGPGAIQAVTAGRATVAVSTSYLDAPPIPVADLLVNEEEPEAAYNILDDEYLVVYERQGVIIGQRLSPSGELVQDAFEISDSAGNKHPSVAYNLSTQSYVVAWEDEESGDINIWARSVAGIHQTIGDQFYSPPYDVTSSTTDQTNPSIACNINESSCLVVFEYHRTASYYEIHAERVNVGVSPIVSDGDTIVIEFEDFISHENPDVVWGEAEGNFLVTWIREDAGVGDVWFARVYDTEQGNFADEFVTSSSVLYSGFSNDQRNQEAAYEPNTGEYLVVFDYDSGPNNDIWGIRVPGSSGSPVVSDLLQIAYSSNSETRPSVAHFGGVFPTYDGAAAPPKLMIAYREYDSLADAYYLQLRSVVLENGDTFVYDEGTVETYDGSEAFLEDSFLVGSWGDNQVFVIWEVDWDATNHYDIYALGLNSESVYLPFIIN